MPQITTYSFADVLMTLAHPSYPPYSMNGAGIGEIKIDPITDNTVQDLAADGSIMVSRIIAPHRHISITVQQASSINTWFQGLYNYLMGLNNSASWAQISIGITSQNGSFPGMSFTNASFIKQASVTFAQQGGHITWEFLAAQGVASGSVQTAAQNILGTLGSLQGSLTTAASIVGGI